MYGLKSEHVACLPWKYSQSWWITLNDSPYALLKFLIIISFLSDSVVTKITDYQIARTRPSDPIPVARFMDLRMNILFNAGGIYQRPAETLIGN